MSQQWMPDTGIERPAKATGRDKSCDEMNRLVAWAKRRALIAPNYLTAGDDHPPETREMVLHVYFVQDWFSLSDSAVEGAL